MTSVTVTSARTTRLSRPIPFSTRTQCWKRASRDTTIPIFIHGLSLWVEFCDQFSQIRQDLSARQSLGLHAGDPLVLGRLYLLAPALEFGGWERVGRRASLLGSGNPLLFPLVPGGARKFSAPYTTQIVDHFFEVRGEALVLFQIHRDKE